MEITTILLLLVISSLTYANYTIKINPGTDWGQWEGWGTSLAWWANTFGEREDFADILFTTKNVNYLGKSIPGLGMNIARYNVGGCSWNSINKETMVVSPKIPKFKQVEGFWLNWDSTDPNSSSWKWDVDKKQQEMMQKAKVRGANKFELFSNSPMWWMLNNHNPSGADNGGNNLQSWNYDKFAIYLATVAKYASDHWGINFASVEAFNEASSDWWKSGGTQEGCHISSEVQQKLIEYLRSELDKRGLHNTIISASDETSYDLAITVWNSFSSVTKSKVGRVNVHGYQYKGGKRDLLYKIVQDDKKALWNSEYGEGDSNGMPLAENLSLDLYWLHPTAWVYWQPFDYGGWGLIQADGTNGWLGPVNTKYYVLAQYSRHIRKGMHIIDSGNSDTVAAYDHLSHRLAIVTLNHGTAQSITYDLSNFSKVSGDGAGLVRRWITDTGSGEHYVMHNDLHLNGKSLTASFTANTVQTFEIDNVLI